MDQIYPALDIVSKNKSWLNYFCIKKAAGINPHMMIIEIITQNAADDC